MRKREFNFNDQCQPTRITYYLDIRKITIKPNSSCHCSLTTVQLRWDFRKNDYYLVKARKWGTYLPLGPSRRQVISGLPLLTLTCSASSIVLLYMCSCRAPQSTMPLSLKMSFNRWEVNQEFRKSKLSTIRYEKLRKLFVAKPKFTLASWQHWLRGRMTWHVIISQ